MATVTIDEVFEIAEQLSPSDQQVLITRLRKLAQDATINPDQRKANFHALIVDLGEVASNYSLRREDWYGEDGR